MPEIISTNLGEWQGLSCSIRTGDKAADLQSSVLEVNIYQSILRPYETGVFYVSNDMDIANMMPIIIGSTIEFKYTLSGINFTRNFTVTGLEYITEQRQKQSNWK